MRIGTTAALSALAVLGRAAPAWAADYWIAPNGSDAADGSATAPWATIQHGVDAMQPGDSVTVADGSYAGFWMKDRQGDAAHRFTIRAQHPLAAHVTGPSPTAADPNDSVQLVSVSFATIDGFDVTGAPRAGISIRTLGDETGADTTDDVVQNCRSHDNGGGVTAGRHDGIFTGFARNVVVQDDEVDHNAEHGVYVSNSADNPIIRRNRSHDNGANGLQINADASSGGDGVISNWLMEDNVVYDNRGAAAINLDGAVAGTLRNNLVYGNAQGGIALFMGDAAEASHDDVVVDNTVFDPNGSRFAIQIDDGADANVVFDNVFWSGAVGMEVGSVQGLVHDFNVVSSYSGAAAGSNESTPDPAQLFVGAATNDYHPGPALLGRGAASLAGQSAAPTDLEGNARPQSGRYDIGCYEQAPAAPAPSPPPTGQGDASAPVDASFAFDASPSAAEASPPSDDASPGAAAASQSGAASGAPTAPTTATNGADASAPGAPDVGGGASAPASVTSSERPLAAGASGCGVAAGTSGPGALAALGACLALLGMRRRAARQ